jgi:hypothetical protein
VTNVTVVGDWAMMESARVKTPMAKADEDYSAELARWLSEVGRRRSGPADAVSEPPEAVLGHLEALAGRKLRSCEAVDAYLADLANDEWSRHRAAERRRIGREGVLLALVLAAYLHYYYWEVQVQIASLPAVKTFVKLPAASPLGTKAGLPVAGRAT